MNDLGPRMRRAAGELGLIVLGVLIALSADRWVEGRDRAAREVEALESIRSDIEADLRYLDRRMGEERLSDEFWLVTDALYEDAAPSDTLQFLAQLYGLAYFQTLQGSRAAFEDLVGSGDMDLISNPELRRSIVRYFTTQGHFEKYGDLMTQELYEFRNSIHDVVDPRIWAVLTAELRGDDLGWSSDETTISRVRVELAERGLLLDWNRIRDSDRLKSGLALLGYSRSWQRGHNGTLRSFARGLVQDIDDELAARER